MRLKYSWVALFKRRLWQPLRGYATDTDEYGELVSTAISDQQLAISKTYYYLYDGIGQIVGLVDEQGTLVVKYTYDSWGVPKEFKLTYDTNGTLISEEEQPVGTFGNYYLYKGYYYDPETGLYYLNARYYDPTLGRFLTPDPDGGNEKDRLSLNPYLYVKNNPINDDDPDGHGLWDRFKKGVKRAWNKYAPKPVKKAAQKVQKRVQKAVKTLSNSKLGKALKSVTKAVKKEYQKFKKNPKKYVKEKAQQAGKTLSKAGKTVSKAYSSSPGGKAVSQAYQKTKTFVKENIKLGVSAKKDLQYTLPTPAANITQRLRSRVSISERKEAPITIEPTRIKLDAGRVSGTISKESVKIAYSSSQTGGISYTTRGFWEPKKFATGIQTTTLKVDYGKYRGELSLQQEQITTFNPKIHGPLTTGPFVAFGIALAAPYLTAAAPAVIKELIPAFTSFL